MCSLQWALMEWGRLPDGTTPATQLVLLQTGGGRPPPSTMTTMAPPPTLHGMPSTSNGAEQSTSGAAPPSSSSPTTKKPLCAVCGDTALGKHYGVLACNGCKGFFRRTVWKKRTYKCRGEGECAINTEQRNACRACRYNQCIRVGMNPRAVQGDLNECRKNGVICTQPKGAVGGRVEREEEEPPSEGCIDDDDRESLPDVKPPTTSTIATQTKDGEEDPSVLAKEIDELVKRFKRVCDRWEEPTVADAPLQDPITQTVRVDFDVIYRHPELVCARSKLDSSAARIADLDDILGDYRRAFVLFCDLLHATPEVVEMEENDQVILAKKSFSAFYWMMTAIWSQTSHKPGVCYANGSYFPTDKEHQRFPDAKDCASRCVFHLNEPVRALVLTEGERAVVAYLACFIDGVPKMSPDGCKKYSAMRDRLLRYLYELCGNTMASRGMRGELAVAGRVSKIISLYPSITDLCMRASDNIEVCDVLQTVKFDSWMTVVSCDRSL